MKFLLIFFIIFYSNVHGEVPKKLKLCWIEAYPYAGKNLLNNGFEAELVQTVMKRAGFETQLDFIPWARCKTSVTKNEYDLLLGLWDNVDTHQENFSFGKNTSIQKTAFLTLKKSSLNSGKLEDMKGVRVGLHRNGGYDKAILDHKGYDIEYLTSDEQKILMLMAGRIDLLISDPHRIDHIIKYSENKNINALEVKVLKPLIKIAYSSPAVSKNHPFQKVIIERYNKAYDDLCNLGLFRELRKKHNVDFKQRDCNN